MIRIMRKPVTDEVVPQQMQEQIAQMGVEMHGTQRGTKLFGGGLNHLWVSITCWASDVFKGLLGKGSKTLPKNSWTPTQQLMTL
eukprot:3735305-Amphidinium_carterae.1